MEHGEAVHLLPPSRSRSKMKLSSKNIKIGFCISSKAVWVIMVWLFAVLLGYKSLYNPDPYAQIESANSLVVYASIFFYHHCNFSPLIGSLADIKLSRYKTVLCSTYIILVIQSVVIPIAAITIVVKHFTHIVVPTSIKIAAITVIGVMAVAYIVFLINGFHFAMDQLLNSSTDDLIKFIHWYVWANYVCILVTETAWNLILYANRRHMADDVLHMFGASVTGLIPLTIILLLVISLCVATRKKVWFFLEPPSVNPYTLLARTIKFAYKHKVPLRRSAFTFCEYESPSRLDLAK